MESLTPKSSIAGNDKLKPFGFYVHGFIVGFIRKIIWLHVTNTNKDPAVIAFSQGG